jgi:hypothetical protein
MKLKRFYASKEIVSKLKRLPTECKKILCQLYMRQGTDNEDIQGAEKTKLLKNQ